MMNSPKAVMFDLDETLAETFAPPAPSMIERVLALLTHVPVALCTAAGMPRIEKDFLCHIEKSPFKERFYVFANSSAECFMCHDGTWEPQYQLLLSEAERAHIKQVLQQVLHTSSIAAELKQFPGEIVDRGAQVVYAALGLNPSMELKKTWDPRGAKRMIFAEELNTQLPDFESRIGGSSTIDITRRGMNKSYGVRWYAQKLSLQLSDLLYIGDAFYPGGNDLVVREMGAPTLETSGPAETEIIIDRLLASFETERNQD